MNLEVSLSSSESSCDYPVSFKSAYQGWGPYTVSGTFISLSTDLTNVSLKQIFFDDQGNFDGSGSNICSGTANNADYYVSGGGTIGQTNAKTDSQASSVISYSYTGSGSSAQVISSSGQRSGVTGIARPGESLTITGSGWTTGTTVGNVSSQICVYRQQECQIATNTLSVDSSGELTGTVAIPSALAANDYIVRLNTSSDQSGFGIKIIGSRVVTISPTFIVGAQTITVSGQNFDPGSTVTVGGYTSSVASGNETSDQPQSVTLGNNQTGFDVQFTVNDSNTDFITAAETDSAANSSIDQSSASLTIVGSASIDSISGQRVEATSAARPGQVLSITGSGFRSNIASGGYTTAICRTDPCDAPISNTLQTNSIGEMSGTIGIPANETAGNVNLKITRGSSIAYVGLRILGQRALSITPASPAVGSQIRITASGFNPQAAISATTHTALPASSSNQTLDFPKSGTVDGTGQAQITFTLTSADTEVLKVSEVDSFATAQDFATLALRPADGTELSFAPNNLASSLFLGNTPNSQTSTVNNTFNEILQFEQVPANPSVGQEVSITLSGLEGQPTGPVGIAANGQVVRVTLVLTGAQNSVVQLTSGDGGTVCDYPVTNIGTSSRQGPWTTTGTFIASNPGVTRVSLEQIFFDDQGNLDGSAPYLCAGTSSNVDYYASAVNQVAGFQQLGLAKTSPQVSDEIAYNFSTITNPTAPSIRGVSAASSTLTVSFTPPAEGNAALITGYEYSLNNGATWQLATSPCCSSPLILSGVSLSSSYQLRIRAVNAVGPGAASAMVPVNATPTGSDIAVGLGIGSSGGGSLVFDNVISPGVTSAVPLQPSSPDYVPPSGFALGSPPTYFDIQTTAQFSGSVDICVPYDPSTLAQGAYEPGLYHFENGQWVNVTTTYDAQTGLICGSTTSFSPFAVGTVAIDRCIAYTGDQTGGAGCDTAQEVNISIVSGDLTQRTYASGPNPNSTTINLDTKISPLAPTLISSPLNEVIITDQRGGTSGWSLTASLTSFESPGGQTIGGSRASINPVCAGATTSNAFDPTSPTIQLIPGFDPSTVAPGLATGGLQTLGSTINLCTKSAATGTISQSTSGVYSLSGTFNLDLPAFQAAGDYVAVLTVTLA
jgi:hypothetical protein